MALSKQSLKVVACQLLQLILASYLAVILISEARDFISLFAYHGNSMVMLSVTVPLRHPLISRFLVPIELFMTSNFLILRIEFILQFR